ncbi:anti-sigma factor family protein [Chondromyces crocatus]|uniref:Putative zinc-finger domain-containing protein n=1 Tax=Chondromyces crocatus TaxID=52 RepID=A0A0K1ERE7_CHOCO|nr:zf-HC2 domain-containing protein [Chondromyces crocatus]AKT43222.1 uncharacterized protein CMC5_074530 [Chondromyces crocatus]
MDCEKFDQHVMDALYEELDELTHAALKRHLESCVRCSSTLAGLRATRDAAVLPLEEPSDDLDARIFAAVEVAQQHTPWRRKALRALAWAGSHAMRPQLAMAALFVLVIGSSLLLLRARPGTVGMGPLRVTEHGMPAPEYAEPAYAPATPAPPAPLANQVVTTQSEAKRMEDRAADKAESGSRTEAAAPAADQAQTRGDQEGMNRAPAGSAVEALARAQAARASSGCSAALPLYDEVGTSYPGTAAAHTAMWEAARCYKGAGDTGRARELFLALRAVDGYRDRVEAELGEQENLAQSQTKNIAGAPGAGAGHSYSAPAPAAPLRAAAKPAATETSRGKQGNTAAEHADSDKGSPARATGQQRSQPAASPAPSEPAQAR